MRLCNDPFFLNEQMRNYISHILYVQGAMVTIVLTAGEKRAFWYKMNAVLQACQQLSLAFGDHNLPSFLDDHKLSLSLTWFQVVFVSRLIATLLHYIMAQTLRKRSKIFRRETVSADVV